MATASPAPSPPQPPVEQYANSPADAHQGATPDIPNVTGLTSLVSPVSTPGQVGSGVDGGGKDVPALSLNAPARGGGEREFRETAAAASTATQPQSPDRLPQGNTSGLSGPHVTAVASGVSAASSQRRKVGLPPTSPPLPDGTISPPGDPLGCPSGVDPLGEPPSPTNSMGPFGAGSPRTPLRSAIRSASGAGSLGHSQRSPRGAGSHLDVPGKKRVTLSKEMLESHDRGQASPLRSLRGRAASVWSRISFAEPAGPGLGADLQVEGATREVHVGAPEKNLGPSNFLVTSHYTMLNFIPKNLFEQFHQISNCYFLLNMIIAVLPVDASPIHPLSAVLPLILVLAIAAVKDGYEDLKRHRADHVDNSAKVTILRGGEWVTAKSMDVRVGDIMYLKRSDAVKADVVVMASSDEDGVVFIETSQLDGETNIKPKKSRPETAHLKEPPQYERLQEAMTLTIDAPNDKLYRWQGVLSFVEKHPLSIKQTIWRGSSIRKTEWAICVVVYAGRETKQGMNLKKKGRKLSGLVKKLNILIIVIFAIKHFFMFLLCGLSVWWADDYGGGDHWYVSYFVNKLDNVQRFFLNYLTFFILFSFLIPISLFVTIEMCKAMQIVLMKWDHEMYRWVRTIDGGEWFTCRPKTSDLNEQLAVIKYIFSDKTGTLTENIMRYMEGVVGTVTRGGPQNIRTWHEHVEVDPDRPSEPGAIGRSAGGGGAASIFSGDLTSTSSGLADDVARYLACMALCHAVVPFQLPDGRWEFEGASPDECALVQAAMENGFLLTKRTSKEVEIQVEGRTHRYEVVEELEFTPTRKMMSIVLKDAQGRYLLLAKGADSSVLPRLHSAGNPDEPTAELNTEDNTILNACLTRYASKGLRTLCLAWRHVPVDEFEAWREEYNRVQCSMDKTDAMIDNACLKLETLMRLAGVCAYEDKLQDGVRDTIRFFVDAGVVVWMLTGDKLETGIEIGRTCGLICPASDAHPKGGVVVTVDLSRELASDRTLRDAGDLEPEERKARRERQGVIICEKLEKVIERCGAGEKITLAIDGVSLDLAMDDMNLSVFVKVCQCIYSAVCCRLTPSQKGRIVELFQKETGETALAIGDGANDATMIGAAKVGIGIIGLEGSQAELASDYAIPRFRHLQRLIAVHGRYALVRNAYCACFSFYKNLVLTMGQVYFAFYSGYTGQTLYDSWMLAIKNTLFTFLPPLLMGCFEKDIDEETLMDPISGPPLFREMAQGKYFDTMAITRWFGMGVVHGTWCFWIGFEIMLNQDLDQSGKLAGMQMTGAMALSGVVYCVIIKAAAHIREFNAIQMFGIVVSMLFYPFVLGVYSELDGGVSPAFGGDAEYQFWKVAPQILVDVKFYIYCLLASVGILAIIDFPVLCWQRLHRPSLRDLWQEYDSMHPSFRALWDSKHPQYREGTVTGMRPPLGRPPRDAVFGCSESSDGRVAPAESKPPP